MVGVPRSRGCGLCLKRKVKCDQARPQCGNCQRYGANCPGYDRGLKFVAGKHVVNKGIRIPTPSNSKPADKLASSGTNESDLMFITGRDDDSLAISAVSTLDRIKNLVTKVYPPSPWTASPLPDRQQYIVAMIDGIRAAHQYRDIVILEHWFDGLPGRLGRRACLDGAICTLVLHVLGKSHRDERLVGESRRLYGMCLPELQRALGHPKEWKRSETMAGIMVLCIFELFANTGKASWMLHAQGVGHLIQKRGVKAFNNDWDLGMLLVFQPLLILQSFFSLTPSFLASPPWSVLLDGLVHRTPYPGVPASARVLEGLAIGEGFNKNLANLTLVLGHLIGVMEARKHQLPVDPAGSSLLKTACINQLSAWKTLESTFWTLVPQPITVFNENQESIFPMILKHAEAWAGSLSLGIWACRLILQQGLRMLTPDEDEMAETYEQESRECLDKILRSIETLGVGISGPYRVGFAIRIAYEFADGKEQIWIRSMLERWKGSYGATDPEDYPPPKAIENTYEDGTEMSQN